MDCRRHAAGGRGDRVNGDNDIRGGQAGGKANAFGVEIVYLFVRGTRIG